MPHLTLRRPYKALRRVRISSPQSGMRKRKESPLYCDCRHFPARAAPMITKNTNVVVAAVPPTKVGIPAADLEGVDGPAKIAAIASNYVPMGRIPAGLHGGIRCLSSVCS